MKFQTVSVGIIIWTLTGVLPSPVRAQSSPGAGGRPLPHPDILELPEDAATSVSAQEAQDAAEPPPGPAAAQARSSESRPVARPAESAGSSFATASEGRSVARREAAGKSGFLRDLWPLLAVLVLIAGLAVILKKFLPGRQLFAGTNVLRIVARTSVSSKQQIMLVKLGRKLVLVGVSPDRMSALCTVDDPDQVALLLGEAASGRTGSMAGAFEASMREEAEDYAATAAAAEDEAGGAGGQLHGLLKKVRTLAARTG